MRRYQIQILNENMTLVSGAWVCGKWDYFYSSHGRVTLRGARQELTYWQTKKWDFIGDQPKFRIYDTKKERPVS